MKTIRDMSEKQFRAAVKRHGWAVMPFGYVCCDGTHLNRFNGGQRRRDQLAYLIREFGRRETAVSK